MNQRTRQLRQSLSRLMDRAGRIGRRSRPGSVLIIVVALLVLMAIIGTAYISSARTDRYSAAQNSFNTEVDILTTGVINMAIGQIADPSYQAASTYPNTNYYDDTTKDTWLADRVPVRLGDVVPTYDGNPGTVYNQGQLVKGPTGGYYTCRINGTTNIAVTNTTNWMAMGGWVDTDIAWPAVSGVLAKSLGFEDLQNSSTLQFQNRVWTKITYLAVNGNNLPALEFYYYPTGQPTKDGIQKVLAASTTNDGIADSFMWRLPVGQLNGITYYTSVRIIDANSAVNVNTAMSRSMDFDYQGNGSSNAMFGFFTPNVGLAELLHTWAPAGTSDSTIGTEIAALNNYRYNSAGKPSGVLGDSTSPYDDSNPTMPIARGDFKYLTRGDALMAGLGRRIENPGYVSVTAKFQALSWAESAQLAYRGELLNPSATQSTLESLLAPSLYTSGAGTYPAVPYNAANFANWFATYYDFSAENTAAASTLVRRPLFVARNPTNNYMPAHPLPTANTAVVGGGRFDYTDYRMPAYDASSSAPRCPMNTAKFGELWRGFWNAMYDLPTRTNLGAVNVRQLGSSIRDPSAPPRVAGSLPTNFLVPPDQMLLLRSGLAAVNALDLRDSDDDVSGYSLPLNATVRGTPNTQLKANCFGTERQPYITEVYANNFSQFGSDGTNQGMNSKGYVAIELYNPYNTAITLTNWQIGIVTNRTSGSAGYKNGLTIVPPTGFTGFGSSPPVIPANGYLVLDNFNKTAGGSAAMWRPYLKYSNIPTGAQSFTNFYYVAGLSDVMQTDNTTSGEFYLLRPRMANGTLQPTETTLGGLVPVDSFDFTGQLQAGDSAQSYRAIHYVRANGSSQAWKFIYPGRYDASKSDARQEGTIIDTWTSDKTDPWIAAGPAQPVALGVADAAASYTNPFPAIQIANTDWGFDKLLTSNPVQVFPFGGFARDADVLQVPFIGGYTITDTTGKVCYELNTLPMDCQMADDNDNSDDGYEQIGRFCPTASASPVVSISVAPASLVDWYDWAGNVLNYFTTQAPSEDFLPNVPLPDAAGVTTATPYYVFNSATNAYSATAQPAQGAVLNRAGTTANNGAEDLVPIEGRININTAPWRVLAMLPMLPSNSSGANDLAARTIVKYRLAHGPFKSVLDLNRVYDNNSDFIVQKINGDPATTDFDNTTGDPSPWLTASKDGVINDFEKRYNTVARISNVITTRSDTFTIYVQVQGYRGIGTATPELVVQRHSAVIVDRSQITANNKSAVVQHSVPTN